MANICTYLAAKYLPNLLRMADISSKINTDVSPYDSYLCDLIHILPTHVRLNKGEQILRGFTHLYHSLTYTVSACEYPVK